MSVPVADVIAIFGRTVVVHCPYCREQHEHTVTALGRTERHAPGCGILRSAADRATGYRFTTSTTN